MNHNKILAALRQLETRGMAPQSATGGPNQIRYQARQDPYKDYDDSEATNSQRKIHSAPPDTNYWRLVLSRFDYARHKKGDMNP